MSLGVLAAALLVLTAAGPAKKSKGKKKQAPVEAVQPAPEPPPEQPEEPTAAPEEVKPAEPAPAPAEPKPEPKAEAAPAPKPVEAAPPAVAPSGKPRLLVLEVATGAGIDKAVGTALSEQLASEVNRRGFFGAMSSKELEAVLGAERQRALSGCSEETSCLAEISGAAGVRFVLAGQLAKLGDAYQLSLQTVDSQKAAPVGRSVRIAQSLQTLQQLLPWAVADATGTPAPPTPSHVLPYALMAGGGLLLLAGGVVAFDGVVRETTINREFQSAALNPAVLRPLSTYQDDAAQISFEKTAGLAAAVVGAGLIGAGFALNPKDASAQVALVPTGNGVALAGAF